MDEDNINSPNSSMLPFLEPEVIIEYSQHNSGTEELSDCNSENEINEFILCVYFKMNKLAAACFNTENQQLLIMNSVMEDGPEYDIMQTLYEQIKPSRVITGSSCSKMFAKVLKNLVEEDGCAVLHRISSKQFNYENCKAVVLNLKVPGDTSEDREQYILSTIDLSDAELISAIGALISFLDNGSHHISYSEILSIKPLYLNNMVHLDEESYINLQVFNPVEHPSGFKWNSKKQDQGISLYSLLSKYCGKISLSHLRIFLMRPTSNINVLWERHQVIQFCNDPNNSQLISSMKKYLHSMSNLSTFLSSIRSSSLRGIHWKTIYKNIHFAALVGEMCKTGPDQVHYFKKVANLLTPEIYALANHIYRTINFDAMENSDKFVIKYGVRRQLDVAKMKYDILQETLNKIVPHEFNCVPSFVKELRIAYIPEIGFLLGLQHWKENLSQEEFQLPELEYKFSAFKIAYYKSKRCKAMDSLIGDPQLEIMQEESEIIIELLKFIENNLQTLLKFINKLAELDCIFSLAALAKEYNYVRPDLVNEKVLMIINGKHPLLSCKIENFIANDYVSEDPKTLQVLYGSNSSGKTVYLKQVALIVYMAHIGSFLPTEKAHIGLLSNIHVHMKVPESVALKSSSFLSELRRLSIMVRGCQGRSLAILDEVCKGTNEESSLPIVCGLLNYFTHKDSSSTPHFLLATHLDLPLNLVASNKMTHKTMNIFTQDSAVTYLYKVIDGTRPNLAFEVALLCGARNQTVQVAYEVINALRAGESVYPYSLKRTIRWNKLNEFLKKFANTEIKNMEVLEKIKRKVKSIV